MSATYVVRLRESDGYCFAYGRGAEIMADVCGLELVDGALPLVAFPVAKRDWMTKNLALHGYTVGDADSSYRITLYRGKPAIVPTDSVKSYGTTTKGRATRLAEALNGQWTHRSRCYTLCSMARLALFESLYSAGWDGGIFGGLREPDGKEWHGNGPWRGYSCHVTKFPRIADVGKAA